MKRLRAQRPSRAMAVALLALLVALGGGAYAATRLPPKSVGTRQLRSGAVTAGKLHRGAVTSAAVKNHSLLARDFRRGQLPAGPQGPPGTVDTSNFYTRAQSDGRFLAATESGRFIHGEVNTDGSAPLATVPGLGTVKADFSSGCQVIFTNTSGHTILYDGIAADQDGIVASFPGAVAAELADGATLILSRAADAPRGSFGTWHLRTANVSSEGAGGDPIRVAALTAAAFWDANLCRASVAATST